MQLLKVTQGLPDTWCQQVCDWVRPGGVGVDKAATAQNTDLSLHTVHEDCALTAPHCTCQRCCRVVWAVMAVVVASGCYDLVLEQMKLKLSTPSGAQAWL
jgi:hypothetical protein